MGKRRIPSGARSRDSCLRRPSRPDNRSHRARCRVSKSQKLLSRFQDVTGLTPRSLDRFTVLTIRFLTGGSVKRSRAPRELRDTVNYDRRFGLSTTSNGANTAPFQIRGSWQIAAIVTIERFERARWIYSTARIGKSSAESACYCASCRSGVVYVRTSRDAEQPELSCWHRTRQ